MDRQYVGIDFHRRRSVIVRVSGSGERLGLHRIVNDPSELAEVMALCGSSPEVDMGRGGVWTEERGESIWICRGQRVPWSSAWPDLRHYG